MPSKRIGGGLDPAVIPPEVAKPTHPETSPTEKEFKELRNKAADALEERNRVVEMLQTLGQVPGATDHTPGGDRARAGWHTDVAAAAERLKSIDRDLGVWLKRILEIGPPPDMVDVVQRLTTMAAGHVRTQQDATPIRRMLTLEHVRTRDTIYILYGYLESDWIEREEAQFKSLVDGFKAKGYKVVVNKTTTYEEWRKTMNDEHMAGLVWSSHGWMSHAPGDNDPDHLVSRVWTTRALPNATSHKIFATEWAERCPDDLAFIVMGSCGTAGVYDKFHDYCEDPAHKHQDRGKPTQMLSFAETLAHKTDTLITYYGPCYGALDRYAERDLLGVLYDRTTLPDD